MQQRLVVSWEQMTKEQQHYPRNINRRLQLHKPTLREGTLLLVRRDGHMRDEGRHKLAPVVDDPYTVVSLNDGTVVFRIEGEPQRMSGNRVCSFRGQS